MSATKRPGLTREVLIETALRLLDEVGLDGLTVRRLAAELGVQSPALYWHVKNKQELLDGMADAIVLAAGMGPPREDESWQDWLLRRCRSYRRSLLAHRDGARVVSGSAALSAETIRLFNDELTAMVGRGFTPVLALRTITAASQFINGFALQEQSAADRGAPDADDRLGGLAQLVPGGMRSALVTALGEGGSAGGDEAFEHGLRVLVDGTAAALARDELRAVDVAGQ
ncbi:TetR/AcrR family transcriptional regulator C-terminal domain-containing protein [Allokutzneria sp. NRRL B-24872]|uniref:TetR/AcrR family transcriptional regulator C-terminal domain-containing protein n=1 Tax=Allokutzneria sp. NRRL B-24872 TaxID=1137961 RepID=UPI000A398A3B|nr:TetR/AcrR family transcriptional regulator C-terminal domain-containing protein [Allokutzneria sp. NRRL B-24872]